MAEQTFIPVDERGPKEGPCAWCGETTRQKIKLEPAKYTSKGGSRRMTKPAKEEWCCPTHLRTIRRTPK